MTFMETLRMIKEGKFIMGDEVLTEMESIYLNYYGDEYSNECLVESKENKVEVLQVEFDLYGGGTNIIDYVRWLEEHLCIDISMEYLNSKFKFSFPFKIKRISTFSICVEGSKDMINEFKRGLILIGCKINQ